MKRTATHNGTCGVCFRAHAVDPVARKIAKHGYTVKWSTFVGTCPGSDRPPFEYSKDLTETVAASLERTAEHLRGEAEKTAARRDKAWVTFEGERNYETYRRERGEAWVELTLRSTAYSDWTSYFAEFTNPLTGKLERIDPPYGKAGEWTTLDDFYAYRNGIKAEDLRSKAKANADHAAYMRERLVGWAPKELTMARLNTAAEKATKFTFHRDGAVSFPDPATGARVYRRPKDVPAEVVASLTEAERRKLKYHRPSFRFR